MSSDGGIEGPAHFGAGLARHLRAEGMAVREVAVLVVSTGPAAPPTSTAVCAAASGPRQRL